MHAPESVRCEHIGLVFSIYIRRNANLNIGLIFLYLEERIREASMSMSLSSKSSTSLRHTAYSAGQCRDFGPPVEIRSSRDLKEGSGGIVSYHREFSHRL